MLVNIPGKKGPGPQAVSPQPKDPFHWQRRGQTTGMLSVMLAKARMQSLDAVLASVSPRRPVTFV